MSAPHPKAQDDALPIPSWLIPNGRSHDVVVKGNTPEIELEPVPINFDALAKEMSVNRLDEIANLMRSLTWREMMDLSEAWNTPAKTLHEWAVGYGKD